MITGARYTLGAEIQIAAPGIKTGLKDFRMSRMKTLILLSIHPVSTPMRRPPRCSYTLTS
jgi:hypothetical protein